MRLGVVGLWAAAVVQAQDPNSCPGYKASNVEKSDGVVTADLALAGDACNIYGDDVKDLKLLVEYQSEERLHVKIYDADERVFQLPKDLISVAGGEGSSDESELDFSMVEEPFSFVVTRKSNNQVLFNTTGQALVFESQYLRIRTSLPDNPNIYGLSESADPFRHDPNNYTHTIWNSGQPFMPPNSNLYGAHPIYYDHRGSDGSHAVFLRNMNGMKIELGVDSEQYLEWNTIGGVFDFYFLAGPTPKELSRQYADLVGYPTLMPYWSFGFHQCRYGYQDTYETAAVVANYSAANIPLETIWNDIDYMDYRSIFSLDPFRFPLERMREFVSYLQDHDQHYIMMVDPAVASRDYKAFHEGVEMDTFLKEQNGSLYTGVVWPGPTNFPDWFAPNSQAFWDQQVDYFFNADSGVDVDGLWIDMNEPSTFCDYPCPDPAKWSVEHRDPPRPPPARMHSPYAIPGFPNEFQPHCMAVVTFEVDVETDDGEDVLLLGDALSLGWSTPYFAPRMEGESGGYRLAVQLPADEEVVYGYVRYTHEGDYIFHSDKRTVRTGECGSMKSVTDTYDASADTITVPTNITAPRDTNFTTAAATGTKPSKRGSPPADDPGSMQGLPGRDLISPPYDIQQFFGTLSGGTAPTNLYHANGLAEYDVHSLYGSMMGNHTRNSLLERRPGRRPFIITRSTAAGDGSRLGHWFGDNRSIDSDYRLQITQMIQFVAMFQMPMVGSDVCGFNYDTNPTLCARWTVLGSWNPFFRNHAERSSAYQELYRWPEVAAAARKAIATRYRLLDYTYTNMRRQSATGRPMLSPVMWEYPEDEATFAIELQFFYGDAFLVSPVTEPNATSVEFYVPKDLFYDFDSYERIDGEGGQVTRQGVGYDEIPVLVRGGSIVPMRENSANTTTALRKEDFTLLIAPSENGTASGTLYLDDGESVDPQEEMSLLEFSYDNGRLSMDGTFGYDAGVKIRSVTVLGAPKTKCAGYDEATGALTQRYRLPLTEGFEVNLLRCCGGKK